MMDEQLKTSIGNYGTAEVLRVELAVVQEVQDSRHLRHIKLQDLVIMWHSLVHNELYLS